MHHFSPNPDLVQSEDWTKPDKPSTRTPVFLIHDGGGTIFSYHCLNPLKRYVYGIYNPHFRTGDTFPGGLPEMARLYSSWVKQTVSKEGFPVTRKTADGRTDVLLGGWSLGGLTSLEMAKHLEDDPVVRVVGILMIDSPYPGPLEKRREWIGSADVLGAHAQQRNQMLARRCMQHAFEMILAWEIPRWGKGRPRAVLLRAKEVVSRRPNGLDRHRGERALGWDAYAKDMFETVVDVEGHHFNLFALARLDGISEEVKRGLEILDKPLP